VYTYEAMESRSGAELLIRGGTVVRMDAHGNRVLTQIDLPELLDRADAAAGGAG
jgi:hypothetical protein